MPAAASDVLADIAAAVLAAAVEGLTADAITVPARSYIHGGPAGTVSWDCLTGDTRVATERGSVPIASVQPGDRVWAVDDGELGLHPVSAVLDRGVRETFTVATRHRTIQATANHRVQRIRVAERIKGVAGNPNRWEIEWVEVDELEVGDYLIVADSLPEHTDDVDAVPLDFAWLAGLVLADGSVMVKRRSVFVCVYDDLARRVADVALDLYGANSAHDMKHGQRISCAALTDDLAALGLDAHCLSLRVPPAVWRWPAKQQRAFLDGYADGDAHQSGSRTNYATPNRLLIEDIRALHQALGDSTSNLFTEERVRPIVIKGKLVKDAKPLHRVSSYGPDAPRGHNWVLGYRGAQRAITDPHLTVDRVASITPAGRAPTYDLSVDQAHTFLADGIVVHNCELLAVNLEKLEAGGRAGSGGQRNTPPRGPLVPLTAVYVCQVVLCYPTAEQATTGGKVTVPAPAEETTAARELLAAGFSARRGVVARVDAGTLTALQTDTPLERRGIGYESCEVGDLTPNPRSPSGGMAAMAFPVRIRI